MTRNLVGAHVSAAGGVFEAVGRSKAIGGTAFSLFLKNEKQWTAKPLEEGVITKFRENCAAESYDPKREVLPHGSYLINLANSDSEKRNKSLAGLMDDLERCEQLGIGLYNLHPGSSLGEPKPQAIKYIAESLNKAIERTQTVKIVLESMTGNPDRIVGTQIEELKQVIDLIHDKSRIGVCIDTCHSLAAGYDLRSEPTFSQFWSHFDNVVGYKYLSGIHLNDSKFPLDSHRDVHQNLGLGFVGLECFRLIMNKPELAAVPKILETPTNSKGDEVRLREIELLKWLEGREANDKEFLERSAELQRAGAKERADAEAKTKMKGAGSKRQSQLAFTPAKKTKSETNAERPGPKKTAKTEKHAKQVNEVKDDPAS